MKVICDSTKGCSEAENGMCGGSKPHEMGHECGNCPRNRKAKCIPYIDKSDYVAGIPEDGGKV